MAAAKRGESSPEVASEGTGKLASFGSDIETQLKQEEAGGDHARGGVAAPAQVAAMQTEIKLLKVPNRLLAPAQRLLEFLDFCPAKHLCSPMRHV